MRKLSPSLGLAVLTAAIWSSEQTVPAAIFPPQGDDTMSSMGVFRVLVAPAFRPLLAPNVGFGGYPGYRSADGRLTSPALLDSATTVGRSAPHNRPLAGSLPVGLPSMGNVGYGDYPAIPSLFAAPAGTREILTQIRSFRLMSSREKCPPDPRVPTVPIDWPMVKAGPDQGVALKSIGMVQENVANGAPDPDFPARSFFDIFVEVSLPSVPGTVSSSVFPALGASLYNDLPLIITNLNLSSLPPNVVYIHGETTAVPLKFKADNPPYWNAGDVFGYLVLAGHGTQADCSSESAFLDAVLGPIGTSRPELPVEWPFPSPRCPPTSSSYNSVRDVDIVSFGPSLLVRNFVHTNLINPILPPPLNASATYNSANTLVTLEASSDGGNTWSPAQASGQVVVGLTHTSDSGNTAFFNTEMLQLILNGSGPLGPFMIRESPTLSSQGKHTIRTNSPDYFVSGFFDVFLELSINGGQTWAPANRPIRVQLTPPTTSSGIPIAVNCSSDIAVTATGPGGAVVTFSSSASGGCKPPVVNCNPPSGSTFPIGTTTVTCTASDTCGNTATCSFKVTVRPPSVEVEVDYFSNTTAQVTFQKPDGTTETVILHGPTEVHVQIAPDGTGPAVADSDGDGLEQVPMEMVSMNLSGDSSMGPVTVNLRPGVATTGQIEETANSNPGRLDVDPFTPGGTATSIFDVNLEVHLGALTLHPAGPVRMQALIRHKPPGPGDSYTNVFLAPVTLLDANGNPTQFKIIREVHTPRPVEVDYFPNTTAQVTLQKPDGTTETVNLHGPTEVHVMIAPDGTGPAVADSDGDGLEQVPTEMVLMNLSGNSSMGPVTVNLRPGVATTGQIEETANSNPGRLDVDPFTPGGTATSIFDVNLEVHLGALTLHPAGPVRMQALIRHKPPVPGDSYTNVFLTPVTLLDANGNPTQFKILREVHTPRPVEVDYFSNTTAQVTLQKPDGSLETVNLTGPTEVHVMIAPDETGPAVADSDGDGLEQVPTEMVLMNLSGNSSQGPVTVNLNPSIPTVGQIEETANPNPGRLDVDPFTSNGTAISTFEVYLQLHVGAQTLHNTQAIHMESLIHHKPPRPGDQYVNPFTTPIPLLDANGNVTGFTLRAEVHTPNPTNPPVEVDFFSNTTAQVTLQKPDGSLETVNLSGPTEVHVMIAPDGTGPAVADSDGDGLEQVPTRMILLNLSGNSSQGPVTVNLSPSLPTAGQIEETANSHPGRLDVDPFTPDGTAVSTFEVYLEVHVAGQTLHNTQAIHMETLIHHKPPRPGERYVNPFTTPIPLLDANGNVTGFTLRAEVHTPNPTNLPPILLACSASLTVTTTNASGAVVTYASSAGGGCPPVNVVCNPPSGSTFPIGSTTVICTASDACGQLATCSFTVTVSPPQQINLACSSNITLTASGSAGRVVTYTSSATSGCPPANVVCNPPSGSPFPIGTTTVTCTASDACSNTAACSFTVTVARPPVAIQVISNQLQVIWSEGKLQEADKLEGPYIDIDPQPTSPFTIPPIGTKKFFRVRVGEPGFTFYDTEMLQLNISGGGLPSGMMIRESPTLASMGKTAISPAPGGGFVIDSFFDVFTELSMNGGQTWQGSTGAPPRMKFTGSAPANTLPPREANYVSPADWHALYAQGIYITNASHSVFTGSFPPPPPGGASDTHSFGSTVNMLVRPCPTCPYQPVSAPAQVTVKVTSRP